MGYSRKYKWTISLLMAIILCYPIVYSFSHVIGHHLFTTQKHIASAHLNEQGFNLLNYDASPLLHFDELPEECPICAYEFALAIEPESTHFHQILSTYIVFNVPISENIFSNKTEKSIAPRAPPPTPQFS